MKEKLWHKSYVPGVKKTVDFEQVTISKALTRSARNFPDHTALNYMGKKITYKELEGLVNCFAGALIDLGIKAGDKVAVCLPNFCGFAGRFRVQANGPIVYQGFLFRSSPPGS